MKENSRRGEIIAMEPGDTEYYPLENVASIRSQVQEIRDIYPERSYSVLRIRAIEKCIVIRTK